jgi:CO/xanthine dehydrogenase FAD-binding subunit
MKLPRFRYLRPSSLEEVGQLLEKYGQDATVVGGGTELFPRMKYGLTAPEILISLKWLPPTLPSLDEEENLLLDSVVSLSSLLWSPAVRKGALMLAEAAHTVGSNEIRNMGTLGGNLGQETRCLYLNQRHSFQFVEPCFKRGGEQCYFIPKGKNCWAVYMADTAPALMCLGAQVKVMSHGHVTQMPLEDLYSGDSIRPLKTGCDEVITAVCIPKPRPNRGSAYAKFSMRGAIEFAALSVAVVLDLEEDRETILEARIVLGAISPAPLHARRAESFLTGKGLSGKLFAEAAKHAAEEVRPFPHHGFSRAYLSQCIRVQTERALGAAAARIKEESKGGC